MTLVRETELIQGRRGGPGYEWHVIYHVLLEVEAGLKPLERVAAEYGISTGTVKAWAKHHTAAEAYKFWARER